MKDWKKLDEVYAYKGYRSLVQKTFELPNGTVARYDIIDGSSFVSIVAITKDNRVLLTSEYRPGPEKVMNSFPAGYIDEGEKPIDAARRELLEETGYKAGKLTFIKEVTNAYTHVRKLTFLATDCEKIAGQQLEEDEFLEIFSIPLKDLKSFLLNPTTDNFVNVDCGFLALEHLSS